MPYKFIYRYYKVKGDTATVREKLTEELLAKGFVKTDVLHPSTLFRYPSLLLSSRRPLTCISSLSLDVTEKDTNSLVIVGFTFSKIRYFTIFIMLFFCGLLPAILGYMQDGISGVMPPPIAFIGIPLGFMVYYHVRWRVFRAVKRLIEHIYEE